MPAGPATPVAAAPRRASRPRKKSHLSKCALRDILFSGIPPSLKRPHGANRPRRGEWVMRTRVGWIVALLAAVAAPSAHASHGPIDTLTTLSSSTGPPVLALDPVTGARHMAYITTGGLLLHGWESPGGWQTETIVDSASITTYTTF